MTDGGWMDPDEERALDCSEEAEPDPIADAIAEGWKRDPYLWGYPDE